MPEILANVMFEIEVDALKTAGEALNSTFQQDGFQIGDLALQTVDRYKDRIMLLFRLVHLFGDLTAKDAKDIEALFSRLTAADKIGGMI